VSSRDYVSVFQAIRVPYSDEPLRVLEERFIPASECTLDVAKAMFMMRFEDKNYARKHGALWPDAVRFLDERGEEILRYTSWNYLRDVTTRESDHHEAAPV
jgi:hypothetical protein